MFFRNPQTMMIHKCLSFERRRMICSCVLSSDQSQILKINSGRRDQYVVSNKDFSGKIHVTKVFSTKKFFVLDSNYKYDETKSNIQYLKNHNRYHSNKSSRKNKFSLMNNVKSVTTIFLYLFLLLAILPDGTESQYLRQKEQHYHHKVLTYKGHRFEHNGQHFDGATSNHRTIDLSNVDRNGGMESARGMDGGRISSNMTDKELGAAATGTKRKYISHSYFSYLFIDHLTVILIFYWIYLFV